MNDVSVSLPFRTAYDPPGPSEGTLDPLGLYQIAEQLAVQLVPAAISEELTFGLGGSPRARK